MAEIVLEHVVKRYPDGALAIVTLFFIYDYAAAKTTTITATTKKPVSKPTSAKKPSTNKTTKAKTAK